MFCVVVKESERDCNWVLMVLTDGNVCYWDDCEGLIEEYDGLHVNVVVVGWRRVGRGDVKGNIPKTGILTDIQWVNNTNNCNESIYTES